MSEEVQIFGASNLMSEGLLKVIPNYTIAAEKRKHVYLAQNELPLLNSKEPRRGDFMTDRP